MYLSRVVSARQIIIAGGAFQPENSLAYLVDQSLLLQVLALRVLFRLGLGRLMWAYTKVCIIFISNKRRPNVAGRASEFE